MKYENAIIKDTQFQYGPITDLLEEFSFISPNELFAVGGCVRDILVGKTPNDIDLCSPTIPYDVIDLCKEYNYTFIPTGIEHGTITILSKKTGEWVEHTTYRQDVSTDGRNATVKYSKSLEEDTLRRDFTVNAMALDVNGNVYDFHSGYQDLLVSGILRTVGNPVERFVEDYLRLLRAVRFAKSYSLKLKALEGYLFSMNNMILNHVSKERIFMEIDKGIQKAGKSYFKSFVNYFGYELFPWINPNILFPKIKLIPDKLFNLDIAIHLLFANSTGEQQNEWPLKSVWKKRLEIEFLLNEYDPIEAVWIKRSTIFSWQNTSIKTLTTFFPTLGLEIDVLLTLKLLDRFKQFPADLQGKDISDWQFTLFKQEVEKRKKYI